MKYEDKQTIGSLKLRLGLHSKKFKSTLRKLQKNEKKSIYNKKYNLIQSFCFGLMGWFIGIGVTSLKTVYKTSEEIFLGGLLYLFVMYIFLSFGVFIYFLFKLWRQ